MENARQDAPDGMWDAIESRLPQPEKAPAVWWRRAGYAMALAAAAAAVVFLLNKPSAVNTYETEQNLIAEILPQEDSRSSLLADSYEQPSEPSAAQPAVPLLRPTTAPAAAPAAQPAPEVSAPEAAESVSEPAREPEEARPQQQAAPQETPAQDKPIVIEMKENPFAAIEEPSYAKRRTQLQINGLVGGNDASQMPFSHSLVMVLYPSISKS